MADAKVRSLFKKKNKKKKAQAFNLTLNEPAEVRDHIDAPTLTKTAQEPATDDGWVEPTKKPVVVGTRHVKELGSVDHHATAAAAAPQDRAEHAEPDVANKGSFQWGTMGAAPAPEPEPEPEPAPAERRFMGNRLRNLRANGAALEISSEVQFPTLGGGALKPAAAAAPPPAAKPKPPHAPAPEPEPAPAPEPALASEPAPTPEPTGPAPELEAAPAPPGTEVAAEPQQPPAAPDAEAAPAAAVSDKPASLSEKFGKKKKKKKPKTEDEE